MKTPQHCWGLWDNAKMRGGIPGRTLLMESKSYHISMADGAARHFTY